MGGKIMTMISSTRFDRINCSSNMLTSKSAQGNFLYPTRPSSSVHGQLPMFGTSML